MFYLNRHRPAQLRSITARTMSSIACDNFEHLDPHHPGQFGRIVQNAFHLPSSSLVAASVIFAKSAHER